MRLVLLTFLSAIVCETAKSEGTKELRPIPASTCYLQVWDVVDVNTRRFMTYESHAFPNYRLNIRIANVNERIYMGFRMLAGYTGAMFMRLRDPNGNIVMGPLQLPQTGVPLSPVGPGFINTYAEAVAGPNPQGTCPLPHNTNPAGYNPLFYQPTMTGDYYIEFNPDHPTTINKFKRLFELFDITVTNNNNVPIPGRLWSKAWDVNMNSATAQLLAQFYVYSKDSVVTRFNFNGMQPFGFIISCNSRGCEDTGNLIEDRKSRPGNITYPEFPLFLNDPDHNQFPSGNIGDLDTIYALVCNRHETKIKLYATNAGNVEILINLNGKPDYQPGTKDVLLAASVNQGWNTITWNNIDGLGNLVPEGVSFDIVATYVWGLTNLPLYDVENHVNGYSVELVRPTTSGNPPQPVPPPLIYWDDSNLPGGTVNLFGCDFNASPTGGCHSWGPAGPGCVSNVCSANWGDVRTVNTWWFTNRRVRQTVHTIDPAKYVKASAGPNLGVCEGSTSVAISGIVHNSGGGTWTSNSGGTFSGVTTTVINAQQKSVSATYHFSAADIALGYVDLFLATTDPTPGCDNAKDTLRVYLKPLINNQPSGSSAYACGGTGTVVSNDCPDGYTCYWQTTPGGTSMADPANVPKVLNPPSGGSITIYLRGRLNTPPHCWTAISSFTMIHAVNPPVPTVSIGPVNCSTGNATITRTSCPTGSTCFWQSGPATFETTNSATTFTTNQPTVTTAYIRARDNTTGCWSPVVSATPVNNVAQPTPQFTVTCNQVVITRTCPGTVDCYWQSSATGTAISGTITVTPQINGHNQAAFPAISVTNATITITATRNSQGTFTIFLRGRNKTSGNCWSNAVPLTFTIYDVSNNVDNGGTTTTLANGYWKGMKNDDWHDPCNWVNMVVPAENTTANSNPNLNGFISGPTIYNNVSRPRFMPQIYSDSSPYGIAMTNNLQIEPGGSLTMNYSAPCSLHIKGNYWIRHGTFYAGKGKITILQNSTIDAVTTTTFGRWFGFESQTRIAGNWTRVGFASYNAGISSVEFFGTSSASISGTHTGTNQFFDLIINKNNVNTLVTQTPGSTIEIGGQLRLKLGCLQNNVAAMTSPDECIVLNDDADAIAEFGENSYVRGKLRRLLLGGATYPYHFPVGHQTTNINYQLATVQFSAVNHGISSLLVYFNGQLPSSFMPVNNIPDQGVLIDKSVGGGFWTLTPSPVMSNGTYTLTLNKRGWTQTGLVYGNLKRANSSQPWAMPGTHISSSPGTTLVCSRGGYTGFSDADIGTGTVVLPVEGLEFTATLDNVRDALLLWTTQREINNYGFEVHHAHQAPDDFEVIGLVDGHGNTHTPSHYRFHHKGLANGRHFYRLRQIDFDGNSSFSNIVEVMVDVDADGHGATLFPNPAHDEITLKMNLAEDTTAEITIYDNLARVVFRETHRFHSGDDYETFNLREFPPGIYHLVCKTNANSHAFKVVKK